MKVDVIQNLLQTFSEHLVQNLSQGKPYEEGYKWDVIGHWQSSLQINELNIGPSVELALQNEFSGRLWGGEKFSIKEGILLLIKENPLYMQAALMDLYNEEFDISMRMNRFVFHCDEVLEILHKRDDRINNHWQSAYSASLFLSLQLPEKYGLFQYDIFYKFMTLVESRNIPVEQDKERYYKILNALYIVISKNQEFMNGVTFILKDRKYTNKSLLLINDFMAFSVENNTDK